MKITLSDQKGLLERSARISAKRRLQFVLARFSLELSSVRLRLVPALNSPGLICELELVMQNSSSDAGIVVRHQGEATEETVSRTIERARRKLSLTLNKRRLGWDTRSAK